MEIQIKPELLGILTILSNERSVTSNDYVENYVNAHLVSQLKTHITNKFVNEQLPDIIRIDAVITTKKEEIDIERAAEVRNPEEVILK